MNKNMNKKDAVTTVIILFIWKIYTLYGSINELLAKKQIIINIVKRFNSKLYS